MQYSSIASATNLPRISIITPSYNQGHFIEETIRSVLDQNYPNLEYIIIDGGSTDNTIEIIKKYESRITYWVSETDRGQTHAINKGITKATGGILAYLNSDDYYLPGTLFKVAEHFRQFPKTDLLHGRCRYVNEQGEKIGEHLGSIQSFEEIIDLWGVWWQERQFVQPEVFWSKRITDQIGQFCEDLHYVMDYEYWCRILQAGGVVGCLDSELTCFRFTTTQKSNHSEAVAEELLQVVQPWLWSHQTALPLRHRLRLQGQWLYQAVLMKQIERSVQSGDRKVLRWLKSALTLIQHPKILLVSGFRERATQYFSRLLPS
ncbi:glycosyltransferase [Leptolyngbya sp. FACHB-541]|uniref:glycosyltransferase family 2 protein n=1 Tax=Leptolyngbya sp. FACHB-541 TaxID=2692810 RepID=UPI0016892BAC|nr:glycosyltransferase family 2 protein [Leptolyngbya sp. FACHB-541]MBD2001069.1 glycosyltransferase [Leptolyngbya sp. FACHB-541]